MSQEVEITGQKQTELLPVQQSGCLSLYSTYLEYPVIILKYLYSNFSSVW